MNARIPAAALLLLLAAFSLNPAYTQDVVRLKNGRTLSGTILEEGDRRAGLRIRLWETGGTISVAWEQIPEAEKRRLLDLGERVGADPLGEKIDGVRVITSTRELIGVVERETPDTLFIKSADSPSPWPVPRKSILKQESLPIQEGDAYSPAERVARRAAQVDPANASAWLDVADYARRLRLFDRAREYYGKARELDPVLVPDIDRELQSLERLVRELDAEKVLEGIQKLREEGSFEEAIAAAEKFLQDFEGTTVAGENTTLLEDIRKEQAAFASDQERFLAGRVEREWRQGRGTIWSRCADRKNTLEQAMEMAEGLDQELETFLAAKLKTTPEKIVEHWEKRQRKKESASYGNGSWIPLDGQDGGSDVAPDADAKDSDNDDDNPFKDFQRKFEQPQQNDKSDKKHRLQSREDWWLAAPLTVRTDWVKAWYAEHSERVSAERETRKCGTCAGQGTLRATRGGKKINVYCQRCHGAKNDVTVKFQ